MLIAEIPWNDGNGVIQVTKINDSTFSIGSSTENNDIDREQVITFKTEGKNSVEATLKITQLGTHELFVTADGKYLETADGKILAVKKES